MIVQYFALLSKYFAVEGSCACVDEISAYFLRFPLSLSVAIAAAFLLSRSGTSPKSKSTVGWTQIIRLAV